MTSAETTRVVLSVSHGLSDDGSAIGDASATSGRRPAGAPLGTRPGAGRRGRRFERHVQLPPTWAVDRSMTWSMNPYSRASSAVNQRSRSESASIRSIGWPVWKAIRSAIMRFR